MFDKDFFERDEQHEGSAAAKTVASIGGWLLHAAKLTFVLYSGYHGINATAAYRSGEGLGAIAGIVGIVTVELVLVALYLLWHNGGVTGAQQSIAAGATYLIGFTLACLGIVADSQLHAGYVLSGWLAAYLLWVLPVAPAIMAAGAIATHELAPVQLRRRREAQKRDELVKTRFDADMARQEAEVETAKTVANFQLNAVSATARSVAEYYRSEDAQAAIHATAARNAPALMRAMGIAIPAVTETERTKETAPQPNRFHGPGFDTPARIRPVGEQPTVAKLEADATSRRPRFSGRKPTR